MFTANYIFDQKIVFLTKTLKLSPKIRNFQPKLDFCEILISGE